MFTFCAEKVGNSEKEFKKQNMGLNLQKIVGNHNKSTAFLFAEIF